MPSRYGMGMGEGLKGCTPQVEDILIGIKDHWKFGALNVMVGLELRMFQCSDKKCTLKNGQGQIVKNLCKPFH